MRRCYNKYEEMKKYAAYFCVAIGGGMEIIMKHIFTKVIAVSLLLCMSGCSLPNFNKDAQKNSEVVSKTDSEYLLPSDKQNITEVDLSKLNETELKYAYEEIYARHGKIYDDNNFSRYFTSQGWYKPNPSFLDSDLSALEEENAAYIKQYINDNFGSTDISANDTASDDNVKVIEKPIIIYSDDYYYDRYNGTNQYIIPDSDCRYLSEYELSGLDSDTLALIRNEIYARHGYIFKKPKYINYFGSMDWYVKNPYFSESDLNVCEKENVKLLKRLEG